MSSMHEEEPPLLDDDHVDIANLNSYVMEKNNPASDATVMEEMMKVATKAKQMKKKEFKNTKKSFGSGFKKGFFNNNPSKTKNSQSKQMTSIVETIPSVKACQPSNQHESTFIFPEVQEALNSINPQEWMNKAFFEKLSREPRLSLALKNPQFNQAIEDMQKDPRAAIKKYKNNPEVTKMLQDFMAFLGSHFQEMGETHDESPIQIPYSENQVEKIVDIQEKQREAIEKMERSPQEEEQVQKILQSPDLIAALSDSNFMSNLKKCQQTPEELQKFITDPVYGPKFRLLLEAGLVSFS